MAPAFSVIVTTYNRFEKLKKALASVYWQTFTDFEVIVADAGSDDGTLPFLASAGLPLRLVAMPDNPGLASLLNGALAQARGRLVAILESDDCWSRDYLASMFRALEGSRAKCARCCYWIGNGRGEVVQRIHWRDIPFAHPCVLGLPETRRRLVLMTYGSMQLSFSVIRRSVFERAGGFDETFKWVGVDDDMARRMFGRYGAAGFAFLDEALGVCTRDYEAGQLSLMYSDAVRRIKAGAGLLPRSTRRGQYKDILLDAVIGRGIRYQADMRRLGSRISAALAKRETAHSFSLN